MSTRTTTTDSVSDAGPAEDLPDRSHPTTQVADTGDEGPGAGSGDVADTGSRDTGATPDARSVSATGPRAAALRTLAVAVAAVLIALLACSAGLLLQHRSAQATVDREHAILDAARRATRDLISPSYREPAAAADRITAAATGPWLAEFTATRDRFVGAIADSRTVAVGEILGAGIERHNPDGTTAVLVSAVSKVTNAAGAADDPRTWRLRVTVADTAGGYKLSAVEVVP